MVFLFHKIKFESKSVMNPNRLESGFLINFETDNELRNGRRESIASTLDEYWRRQSRESLESSMN